MTRQPRYDADEVKAAARGRWDDLIPSICGISSALLDGRGHPCPVCGDGTDRFVAFKDFKETGGVLCRQCHNQENGDGLSTIALLLKLSIKKDFQRILALVAERLGLPPKAASKKSGAKKSDAPKPAPDEKLVFQEWSVEGNELLAGYFCIANGVFNAVRIN